jgi:ABC-type nitrate/sulfonate/bicarbonate transport system ATPase subunit
MKIENLSKIFETKAGLRITLFENIAIEVADNVITSIIAPLGSGKNSMLKILAGLDLQKDKNNQINNSVYIPSEPSSFPWMNVTDNIKFGNYNISSEQIKNLCTLVGLEGYESHFPNNKSLGFRFRISLARSLAVKPQVILLDEPFSKMDHLTKHEMYQLVLEISMKLGITMLLATSNLSEAVLLSNKIHLMKHIPLELLKTISCEHDSSKISERLTSPKYSKCLAVIEELVKSTQNQQSFTISL